MRQLYLLFLVLITVVPTLAEQNVYHDNVVVVIDASGSMGHRMSGTHEQKMDVAKQALKTVLHNISDSTHVGIVVFGDVKQSWIYELGPKDKQKINDAINQIKAGGGTPLGEYIKKGADALLRKREKQLGYGSYRLLVVTDGEAGDNNLVEAYVPDVKARGIILDVIGVDMDKDHTLATKVHSYRKGNDPASLTKAIQEVFAEVSSHDNDNIESDFKLLEPLDERLASIMIQALSQTGNHLIGETPKSKIKIAQPDGTVIWVSPAQVTVTSNQFLKYGGLLILFISLAIIIVVISKVILRGGYFISDSRD